MKSFNYAALAGKLIIYYYILYLKGKGGSEDPEKEHKEYQPRPKLEPQLTARILACHVLGTGCFALINAQIGNVEWRRIHVIRGELMAQRAMTFRRCHRQIVQL